VNGYIDLPEGWEVVSEDGPGPFVTSEVLRRPDGSQVRWRSRAHRKDHSGPGSLAATPAGAPTASGAGAGGEPAWWRPRRRGWWMSVLFALGSLCFAVAAVASQWASSPRPAIDVTFFVGSIFFTSASYLQYAETVNVVRGPEPRARRRRWRPASWEPRRIDWLAASVQLVGTVLFNISTFAALKHGLSTSQSNRRVWAPDVFGSICFLVSSELAYAEVCHRWVCLRRRSLSWWIVALNLMGSIAFGVAAIASLLEPSSGEPISAHVANAGTALGGLCFLVGALALMPEAVSVERASPVEPQPSGAVSM
jgi:YrhK-like protein